MSGGKAVCLCCIAFIFISLIYIDICVGRFGGGSRVFLYLSNFRPFLFGDFLFLALFVSFFVLFCVRFYVMRYC